MANQKTGGKGARKIGRNKRKCEIYKQRKTREKNKLGRVLQSCGYDFAFVWAKEHNLPAPPKRSKVKNSL